MRIANLSPSGHVFGVTHAGNNARGVQPEAVWASAERGEWRIVLREDQSDPTPGQRYDRASGNFRDCPEWLAGQATQWRERQQELARALRKLCAEAAAADPSDAQLYAHEIAAANDALDNCTKRAEKFEAAIATAKLESNK